MDGLEGCFGWLFSRVCELNTNLSAFFTFFPSPGRNFGSNFFDFRDISSQTRVRLTQKNKKRKKRKKKKKSHRHTFLREGASRRKGCSEFFFGLCFLLPTHFFNFFSRRMEQNSVQEVHFHTNSLKIEFQLTIQLTACCLSFVYRFECCKGVVYIRSNRGVSPTPNS